MISTARRFPSSSGADLAVERRRVANGLFLRWIRRRRAVTGANGCGGAENRVELGGVGRGDGHELKARGAALAAVATPTQSTVGVRGARADRVGAKIDAGAFARAARGDEIRIGSGLAVRARLRRGARRRAQRALVVRVD